MWWVLVASVAGLIGLSFITVCWFSLSRVRSDMVKKGRKYTFILIGFSYIVMLCLSIFNLLRELTLIQKGSMIDNALSQIFAILFWILLPALAVGMILDVVRGARAGGK